MPLFGATTRTTAINSRRWTQVVFIMGKYDVFEFDIRFMECIVWSKLQLSLENRSRLRNAVSTRMVVNRLIGLQIIPPSRA